MIWKWNDDQEAWLLDGESGTGCGVFKQDSVWHANVIMKHEWFFLGPFDTPEIAKQEAEKEFELRSREEN